MATLSIKGFAQLEDVDIQFGDLTVLVGPQATGKSLVLQMLKYAIDRPVIASDFARYGLDWDKSNPESLLAAFLGEGYENAFTKKTSIQFNHRALFGEKSQRSSGREPAVFFVPAQRVMTIANGWPKPFMSFEPGDPYVVKQFSQEILEQFSRGVGRAGPVFPQPKRLNAHVRRSIEMSIFHGGELLLKSAGRQKRLIIRYPGRAGAPIELPFFEWSAGQREFSPLLLGLYQLLPAGKISSHRSYRWAVIEEPEMGLHPQAINSVMLLVFELLSRGYKVCMSTHSPYVLELVWAIHVLQRSQSRNKVSAVLEAINVQGNSLRPLAKTLLEKSVRAYAMTFSDTGRHRCTDISEFDLESPDPVQAGWGGVTSLSSIVSRAVSRGL
ncbi:MAG TPA: AAA family ATPase [Ramlibacter sp.]|uniref:AAA family ATPase n=1 Tax=Ramlibacter sp. TaxID=1917967 RepID=UPI002C6BB0E8|nr:AAA family ATPase [Ramlibacter sp.]HVZ43570.1 AAA family ATPase [Ramlibacter sp.]